MLLKPEIRERDSPNRLPPIFQKLIHLANQFLDRTGDVDYAVCPMCHRKNDITATNPAGNTDPTA